MKKEKKKEKEEDGHRKEKKRSHSEKEFNSSTAAVVAAAATTEKKKEKKVQEAKASFSPSRSQVAKKEEEEMGEERDVRHQHKHEKSHQTGEGKKKKEKKKRSISLSFGEEIAEEEVGAVYKKTNLDRATAQRMKAERLQAMHLPGKVATVAVAAAAAAPSDFASIRLAQTSAARISTPSGTTSSFSSSSSSSLRLIDKDMDVASLLVPGDQAPSSTTPATTTASSFHLSASSLSVLPSLLKNEMRPTQNPVCIAQAASTRGPKADMEDTHVIVASLKRSSNSSSILDLKRGGGGGGGGGGGIDDDPVPVSFYGVFDGHCGPVAAELAAAHLHRIVGARKNNFLGGWEGRKKLTEEECVTRAKKALEESFAEMEALIMKALMEDGRRQDGSTAITAVVAGERLFVANLGDCRAVLATQTPEGRVEATRLSVDHKPDVEEEKKRIVKAGGSVEFSGCWRVAHSLIPMRLAVSRSFGDPAFKRHFTVDTPSLLLRRHVSGMGMQEEDFNAGGQKGLPLPLPPVGFEPLVSPVPEVTCRLLTRDDLFLVLASDGVWDMMSDLEAVLVVAEVFQQHNTLGNAEAPFTEFAVKKAAERLIDLALSKGAYDNCTVLVVGFQVQ